MAFITAEEVKVIRKDLKKEFGADFKFSVTKRHHSTVVVMLMKGPLRLKGGCAEINRYRIKENLESLGNVHTLQFWKKVEEICMKEHWDQSDSMTDYYNCSFYFDMGYGTHKKDFISTKPVHRITADIKPAIKKLSLV